MARKLTLYALSGSQRRASTSSALLRALAEDAPDGLTVEICDLIGAMPVFNPDDEGDRTPAVVAEFAARIRAADGLIIACPEYVHGIPGGFKNALDWLVSSEDVPFKPVMIAHASHRGEYVLAQLTEVLRTMSLRLAGGAFLRLPLAGMDARAQQAVLAEARQNGILRAALNAFATSILGG
jgi:NAD(P)H-dependent FMN reductase